MCFQWNHDYKIVENVPEAIPVNDDDIEIIEETALKNRQVDIKEIVEDLNISYGSTHFGKYFG